MRMIVEHFVTFLFLLLFLWVGISYMIQNVMYSSAREFHGAVVTQLENSYFAAEVIEDCQEKAERAGYELEIDVYGEGNQKDARVSLVFHYTVPLSGEVKNYEIEGYAR